MSAARTAPAITTARTSRTDLPTGFADRDIRVVDHQVQDHIDIQRTGREHAQPVHTSKNIGRFSNGRTTSHCRVEALQMPHLHDAALLARTAKRSHPPQPGLGASGFSISRSMPHAINSRAHCTCRTVGTHTLAAPIPVSF